MNTQNEGKFEGKWGNRCVMQNVCIPLSLSFAPHFETQIIIANNFEIALAIPIVSDSNYITNSNVRVITPKLDIYHISDDIDSIADI
jgi:hypothetical protein